MRMSTKPKIIDQRQLNHRDKSHRGRYFPSLFNFATPHLQAARNCGLAPPQKARDLTLEICDVQRWWACLDSNQEPDRYQRSTPAGNSNKTSVSRSRSFTFVRVCSRGFCRITGGMEDRRELPTGLRPDGSAFRPSCRYRAKGGLGKDRPFR